MMESDLEAVIKDTSIVLSAADVKSYMQMAMQGLAVCHDNNVCHRDIKPNNLLIARSGVHHAVAHSAVTSRQPCVADQCRVLFRGDTVQVGREYADLSWASVAAASCQGAT